MPPPSLHLSSSSATQRCCSQWQSDRHNWRGCTASTVCAHAAETSNCKHHPTTPSTAAAEVGVVCPAPFRLLIISPRSGVSPSDVEKAMGRALHSLEEIKSLATRNGAEALVECPQLLTVCCCILLQSGSVWRHCVCESWRGLPLTSPQGTLQCYS